MNVLENTYFVKIRCVFDEMIVKGLLAVLLYNDPKQHSKRGKISALETTKKSNSDLFVKGKASGLYYITIHSILRNSNKMGSRIPFGRIINIPHPKIPTAGIIYFSNIETVYKCVALVYRISKMCNVYTLRYIASF